MRPQSTTVNVMESHIYLTPSTRPPRRKSPVFYLLLLTSAANIAVLVLSTSRLGKELQAQSFEKADLLKLVSITYSLLASLLTVVFLTLTTAFFKAVYPPNDPISSGFRELRLGEKANIVGNFCSAVVWIAALGLMIAELWELGRVADQGKGGDDVDGNGNGNGNGSGGGGGGGGRGYATSVESDGRLWARMGLTVFVMLGLLGLGWYSMQRVWRRQSRGGLGNDSRVEMVGRYR